jgi:hypothetical protein
MEGNIIKWLIINTEAFSPKGLKQKKSVSLEDLPWVVQKFLSAFPHPFIVLDECFVAGTRVDCVDKYGNLFKKGIESVRGGDRIFNAVGEDYVKAVGRKEVTSLVEIRTEQGVFVCSENHLFFTLRGWIPARDIRTGDCLMETAEAVRLLQQDFHTQSSDAEIEAFLRDELLFGHYYAGVKNWFSNRRVEPQWKTQGIGQKERQDIGFIRVEGVAVLKQGSSELDTYRDAEGHIYCYDIKAKRHPSFSVNGVLVHNCSKIKTNTPMKESDKSSRTRTIKLLNKFGQRCIMTGTLMSKSPLNVVDPYNFLKEDYFPESMWELAEQYCVMQTIHVGRGRRVLISQKDYTTVRTWLKNAFIRGGEIQLEAAKESIFKQFGIDYVKQEHIIRHRKYTPFINEKELLRRIAPDTLFVKREDVFDIRFDKFVKEPITRPVRLSQEAKRIANELIELGFTDRLVLGKAAALELMTRLQDVCNGFEPVKDAEGNVSYRLLSENPKLDELITLMEEIDVTTNQMVIWASRRNLLDVCAARFEKEGYTFVRYDGSASDSEKEKAEQAFIKREASIFLANQASGAFGLNCLAQCSYAVYMCVDGSVEKYHQSQHRILRGQLTAPKFAYAIYAEGTVEERQWTALHVGKELLEADNRKEKFIFV